MSMEDMGTGKGPGTKSTAHLSFPQYPGEGAPLHLGRKWKEAADDELKRVGYYDLVYNNGQLPACRSIVDFPLADFPEHPPAHPDHEKRKGCVLGTS